MDSSSRKTQHLQHGKTWTNLDYKQNIIDKATQAKYERPDNVDKNILKQHGHSHPTVQATAIYYRLDSLFNKCLNKSYATQQGADKCCKETHILAPDLIKSAKFLHSTQKAVRTKAVQRST